MAVCVMLPLPGGKVAIETGSVAEPCSKIGHAAAEHCIEDD